MKYQGKIVRPYLQAGIACLLILTLLAILSPLPADAQAGYKLIANPSVPQDTLKKDDVSKIFFKKVKKWDGSNVSVEPVDLTEGSRVRDAFSDDVHGRNVKAIKSYWQRQIFSGRGTPPQEVADEDEMIRAIASTPGAVGYVSPTKAVSGVKVIAVTD